MRSWTPQTLYDVRPWIFVAVGGMLALGMMGWSLGVGSWSLARGLLCFGGAALCVAGGATVQLRQEYRARSKWRRAGRP